MKDYLTQYSQRNLQAQLITAQVETQPMFIIECFTKIHKANAQIELRYCNEFLR
jgi:hypothetical protein